MKKVAFYTLGCKVNQDETESLEGLFKEKNYQIVPFEEFADVYIINTCTVTHLADRKSRQYIRRAVKNNPRAIIAVTGCYAQTSYQEIKKIPGVDLIIGTSGRNKIVDLVEQFAKDKNTKIYVTDIRKAKDFEEIPVPRLINRTRAYLKVQEGCEQFCTYCIIPYSRGPYRSRTMENTIKEAKKLVAAGFNEIILTGIHLGAYGKDNGKDNIFTLCQTLLKEVDIKRLRLSSIEPTEISDDLLNLMAADARFCRHFHIPLQSGDDRILKLMNRPYQTSNFKKIVGKIRDKIPSVGITSDFIVGFPGEDDEAFSNSVEFVKNMAFSDLHVFKYSPRRGTPASKFANQVPAAEKELRSKIMLKIAKEGFMNFAEKFIHTTVEVLVERKNQEGYWEGHTDNYIPVTFLGNVKAGDIVDINIKSLNEKGFLEGELV